MKTRRYLLEVHGLIPVSIVEATGPEPAPPPHSIPGPEPGPPDDPEGGIPEELARAYADDPERLIARLAGALASSGITQAGIEERLSALAGIVGPEELEAAKRIIQAAMRRIRKAERRDRMARHDRPAAPVVPLPGVDLGRRTTEDDPEEPDHE